MATITVCDHCGNQLGPVKPASPVSSPGAFNERIKMDDNLFVIAAKITIESGSLNLSDICRGCASDVLRRIADRMDTRVREAGAADGKD